MQMKQQKPKFLATDTGQAKRKGSQLANFYEPNPHKLTRENSIFQRENKFRRQEHRIPPLNGEGLIVPVVLGANHIDIGVHPSLGWGARAADCLPDLLRQGFRWGERTDAVLLAGGGLVVAAVVVGRRGREWGRCGGYAAKEEEGRRWIGIREERRDEDRASSGLRESESMK